MSASNKLIQAAAGVGGEEADADFANTVLLLNADDASNGGQNNTFLDSSSNAHTITRNGNVTQGSFSPFSVDDGKWGNYFDGSGDYLVIDDGTLNPSAQDMTYEMWLYLTSTSAGLVFEYDDGSTGDLQLYHAGSGGLQFKRSGGGEPSADATISINEWVHIACVIDGTTLRIFVNGVEADSDTTTAPNSETQLNIGSRNGGTVSLAGYISNFRVVSGTALYTTGFTPSTTPLTAISGTSLLTCQSNRFVDNSSNAHSITVNGDTKVVPFSPFPQTTAYDASTNGGSGYFDGTGDSLSMPDSADFDLSSSDFTLEGWFYRTGGGDRVASNVLNQSVTGASSNSAFYFGAGNNGLSLYLSTSGSSWTDYIETGVAPALNAWTHLAWVRNGNTLSIYLNGVQQTVVASGGQGASFSGTVFNSTRDIEIGTQSAGSYINGNLSDLRLVKGTAVYTSAFTPPTAPLTDVTNTSLLTNFTNASIVDATGKNVLETVGNAQVDTTTVKYGTGAMEFDGTGDGLEAPASTALDLGSGAFTIEAWIYPTSLPNTFQTIVITSDNSGGANGIGIWARSTNEIQVYDFPANSAIIDTSGFNLVLNQWTHIAVVRSGSTVTLYKNGVSFTTGTSTSAFISTTPTVIGNSSASSQDFVGFIDDLRITRGIARYTANFTPPEKALPVIGEE